MDPRLLLTISPPQTGLEPGAARSAGQHLTYWAATAPLTSPTTESEAIPLFLPLLRPTILISGQVT